MTSPDLHPEDLIERSALGTLSAAEAARLEAHRRQCAVCRFEQAVRSDFESEVRAGVESASVRHLVGGLLLPPTAPRGERAPAAFWIQRALAFAAVALLAGAGAGAGAGVASASALALWGGGSHGRRGPARDDQVVAATGGSPAGVELTAKAALLVRASGAPAMPAVEPPAVDRLPPEARRAPAISVASDVEGTLRREALAPPAQTSVREPGARAPASSAPAAAASSAAALFDHATAARRSGHHTRAREVYADLLRSFPGSPEARTARAVFGRMLLDDGEDEEAVRQFAAYLHAGAAGVLAEDALLGEALAYEHLGRTRDSEQAWSTLLQSFPESVHAGRARDRLLQLEKH